MYINTGPLQRSNHGSGSEQEDQERFWLITDALMMNDLEDLKRVHNLANYLMVRRIKDNTKVAEA